MKYKKNSYFFIIIEILIFIVNFKDIKGSNIKCEDCEYDYDLKKCKKGSEICSPDCRPHLYEGRCYDCSKVFTKDSSKLYSIVDRECVNSKNYEYMVSETNEVVQISDYNQILSDVLNPNMYLFGNIIYRQCPDKTSHDESSDNHRCKCNDDLKVYIDQIFGKYLYRCVDSCPYGYYFFNENVNYNVCTILNSNSRDKHINLNNFLSSNCASEQPLKYIVGLYTYCLDNCPASAPFFYNSSDTDNENKLKCLATCNNQDFYFSNTKECTKKCGNFKSLIDIKTSTFICDTNEELKFKTYSLISNTIGKKCVRNCSTEENNEKKYYDIDTLTCIENCTETSKKYINGYECVESCEKFHNYGTFQCIDNCGVDGFLYESTLDNTCYKDCTKLSSIFYFNEDKTKCFANCSNYILKTKEDENDIFYCLDGCERKTYTSEEGEKHYVHRYNDNICIKNCEVNSDISKYYYINKDNVCYQSCKEIANSYQYEYNSECYTEINPVFENYLHYKINGVTKYKSEEENDLDFCLKAGFYYIDRNSNECKNCEGFKIPYSLKRDDGGIENLGECLTQCNTTYPYYNEVDKICQKVCNHKAIIRVDGLTLNLGTSDKGNCVTECPISVYIYESSNGTFCYNKCPSEEKYFYKIGEKRYKCIKDCTTISKFYIETEAGGECLDKCGSLNSGSQNTYSSINIESYLYYIPGNKNNKCLTSCIEQNKYPFSLQGSVSNPQPCLKECPLRYHYYNDDQKICLSSCPKYFDSQSKQCIDSCPSSNNAPYKFIINENECSNKCTENANFIVNINNNEVSEKKCSIKCDSENHLYYEVDLTIDDKVVKVYQCTNNCTTNDNQYTLQYGDRCVDKCPEETFQENNECKLKCQNLGYFKRTNEEGIRKFECKSSCEESEYIGSNKECITKCPRHENFVNIVNGNKKCQSYCDKNYKYHDNGNDEFGYYTIYQCEENCNNEYILDGTKECVNECTEDKPYLLGNVCVSICLKDQIKPFSATKHTTTGTTTIIKKECAEKCSSENDNDPKYFGDDKICVESCNIFEHKKYHNEKENDYSCVSHCNLKSENRFTYYDESSNKYYCLSNCNYLYDKNNNLAKKEFYSTDDYVCNSVCNERNIFLIPTQKIFANKCPDSLVANPSPENELSISKYKCEYTCKQGTYYYESERICGECKANHYIIQGTQKCIEFCDQINSQKKYYSYEKTENSSIIKKNTCVTECPEDKPFIDYNNHCSDKCTKEYMFYSPSEKKCMDKCPEGTLTNGDKCVVKCPKDKFEDSIAKVCLDDCYNSQRNYIYYYESERVCLKECRPGHFVYKDGNNYKCMNNCSNINKQLYIDGNNCVEKCPEFRRYFVNQTIYGEVNISKYCLTDCPIGFEFYKYDNFECSGICYDYYITNKDPNVIGKECVKECNNIYQFIFIHNNTHKECVEFCPEEKMYYEDVSGMKTCYEKCPPSSPFHIKGNFKCLNACPNNVGNKFTMECVSKCEINQFWGIEKQSTVETKMCYDNCNQTNYAQFATFERKCVKECNNENEYLQGNLNTGECECRGLYY